MVVWKRKDNRSGNGEKMFKTEGWRYEEKEVGELKNSRTDACRNGKTGAFKKGKLFSLVQRQKNRLKFV